MPQADAAPFAELPADLPVDAGFPEAVRFVEPDAALVGQGDRGDRLGEALCLEDGKQVGIEGRANASAMSAIGAWQRYGVFYFAGLAIAAGIVAYHYRLIRTRTREGCFRAFLHNNWIGLAIFAGIALDKSPLAVKIPL